MSVCWSARRVQGCGGESTAQDTPRCMKAQNADKMRNTGRYEHSPCPLITEIAEAAVPANDEMALSAEIGVSEPAFATFSPVSVTLSTAPSAVYNVPELDSRFRDFILRIRSVQRSGIYSVLLSSEKTTGPVASRPAAIRPSATGLEASRSLTAIGSGGGASLLMRTTPSRYNPFVVVHSLLHPSTSSSILSAYPATPRAEV